MEFIPQFKFKRWLSPDFFREVLDLLSEFSYLAAIFLVPLWFAYFFPTYNIFEFNKLAIFQVLVWLLFLFTALKLIFFRSRYNFPWRGFFKKYWLWPLVFISGLSLSLVVFGKLRLSFYGTIERQAGLVSYLFCFFWFLLLSFNILTVDNHFPREADDKNKKIRRIIITAVASASLVAVYGILQILGLDFIVWPEAAYITRRAFSTFGQPNFLASWLLLAVPLSFYLGYSARYFLAKSGYFFLAALQIIALFLTGSRGGLVALFFAGGVYLIYLFVNVSWPRRRKFFLGGGFIILILLTALAASHLWGSRMGGWKNFYYGSVGARANFYAAAAEAIKERPVFGYGLESGEDIFIKYYEPDWAVYGDVGQSADKAHNLVLDIILSVGFSGLILFVWLYYFFFSLAAGNLKKKKSPALSLALTLGVSGYLFSLLFSFSVVAGEIYFWLFLALLVAINHEADETSGPNIWERLGARLSGWARPGRLTPHWRRLSNIIIALVVVFFVFWRLAAVFRSLTADYYFNNIYFILAEPDYFTALVIDGYLKEQRTNPVNQISYDNFWGEKLSEFYSTIDELAAKKIVDDKLKEINRSLPGVGYKNLLVKAKINDVLGRYAIAQDYLDRVVALTPHWPLAYLEQGRLSANQNNFPEALVAYNLALVNLPDVDDERLNDPHRDLVRRHKYFIYLQMGNIYERQDNFAAAGKYYSLAYQNNPADFIMLKRLADMEYRRGNLKAAIAYTKHGLARSPQDYKWSIALAALYYETGDKGTALKYLESAARLAPDSEEIKNLFKEYKK
jgi:O-antigen ligase